ncbi:hypothetical protein, partial [Salmonella enterica]|uniref:hypothetical protein n=1 Tax=Salmonella enterica TaxID=28901 RepID=UPI001C535F09
YLLTNHTNTNGHARAETKSVNDDIGYPHSLYFQLVYILLNRNKNELCAHLQICDERTERALSYIDVTQQRLAQT